MIIKLPPLLHPNKIAFNISYFVKMLWEDEIQFFIGKNKKFEDVIYLSMESSEEIQPLESGRDGETLNSVRLSGVGRYCMNPINCMGDIKLGSNLKKGRDIANCLENALSNSKNGMKEINFTSVGIPVLGTNEIAIYFSLYSKKLYEQIEEYIISE